MEKILDSTTANVKNNVYFSTVKNVWWDLNNEMRPLQQVNQLVMEYIKKVLTENKLVIGTEGFQLPKNLLILDVGCGGGFITEPLARAGAQILGIDINSGVIESAQEHAKLDPCLKSLSYRCESIEEHFKGNIEKYDIVILNFVLHHAENHDQLLKDCIKTLKPGGIFFTSSISKTFEAWLRVIVVGEILVRYFKRGSFHWNNFINSSDVEKILIKNNCELQDIKGIYYDVFSSYWRWCDSTNGLYLMHAAKQK